MNPTHYFAGIPVAVSGSDATNTISLVEFPTGAREQIRTESLAPIDQNSWMQVDRARRLANSIREAVATEPEPEPDRLDAALYVLAQAITDTMPMLSEGTTARMILKSAQRSAKGILSARDPMSLL